MVHSTATVAMDGAAEMPVLGKRLARVVLGEA
jgi:hypothetical protein